MGLQHGLQMCRRDVVVFDARKTVLAIGYGIKQIYKRRDLIVITVGQKNLAINATGTPV